MKRDRCDARNALTRLLLRLVPWLVALLGPLPALIGPATPALAAVTTEPPSDDGVMLSPYWGPEIQRWAHDIAALSAIYGFHPDFIAAVVWHEGDREYRTSGRLGAVGLTGLLPARGAGRWRSSSETLLAPGYDLRWGISILSHVVQQAGGDLYTALAAYNGGWEHVDGRLQREYATRVLDSYARAVLVRAGLSPQAAARWTVAVEIRAGNLPEEPMIVLGQKPFPGAHLLASHTVYAYTDGAGLMYLVSAYVVPLGLTEIVATNSGLEHPDELEAPLRARLGEKLAGSATGTPRVLLACLAGMERLRGRVTTRWFAPSSCPPVGR